MVKYEEITLILIGQQKLYAISENGFNRVGKYHFPVGDKINR
jgi:hypothetical protein